MRGLFGLAAATVAAFVTSSLAIPLTVQPGNSNDIVITKENTLNSTAGVHSPVAPQAASPLKLEIVNNFSSNQMYLYITGQDSKGSACFVDATGKFYYPNAGGSAVPVPIKGNIATSLGKKGSTTKVTVPDSLISARIWVAEGKLQFNTVVDGNGNSAIVEPSPTNPKDPSANIKWGFVEFNWQDGNMYANISYVDWVGISMGMGLTLASGKTQVVKGLKAGAVDDICKDIITQNSKDKAGWNDLCVKSGSSSNAEVIRVLSPNLYIADNATWQSSYYTDYINKVWSQYTNADLTIDTQGSAGKVTCRVTGGKLTCKGDNRAYPKPTLADIYGCNSGPFAIVASDNAVHKAVVPRLCAAFNRSTFLLKGGNVQPGVSSKEYYTANPTNHYSRIVHKYEQDGLGYAFSYDDVNPGGENAAGTVSGSKPTLLKVTAGSWS
ncbi:glycoside hydrolase family 64 protein [Xylaria intraflava]|nr:glycoside hydrolase family 64 protein [Xylaria intraflava]